MSCLVLFGSPDARHRDAAGRRRAAPHRGGVRRRRRGAAAAQEAAAGRAAGARLPRSAGRRRPQIVGQHHAASRARGSFSIRHPLFSTFLLSSRARFVVALI